MVAPRRIRLIDVARQAGVSTTAASLALAKGPGACDLAAGTIARVRAVAGRLGYRGAWTARAMRAGRTGLIGLLFAKAFPGLNAFQAAVVSELSDLLLTRDSDLVLLPIADGPIADGAPWRTRIGDGRLDGAVVMGDLPAEAEAAVAGAGLRCVRFNAPAADGGVDPRHHHVGFDDARAVHDAVAHLRALGHRRIGWLARADARAAHGSEAIRERAWREATVGLPSAAGAGLRFDDPDAVVASIGRAQGPSAVIGYSDLQALRLHAALLRRGLRLPDDLALVGIDDLPAASLVTPALSTVALPIAEAVRRCVDALLAVPAAPRSEILAGALIARASTLGTAAASAPAPVPDRSTTKHPRPERKQP